MARPADWDEVKEPHKVRLTPTCWRNLNDIATANDLPSRVEAIEHLSRYAVKQAIVFDRDDISLEAIAALDKLATDFNISRSELVERIARLESKLLMGMLADRGKKD